ncbi:hypothetical protein MYX77_06410 [Acidobacteriia bacterium AH_259_A11_L15]|nr:hypothetical protein [Acidobacteriia bacterium AH_259_A11_L15]
MAETPAPALPPAPTDVPQIKIKLRRRRQRACDEKNQKGKVCCGHLKRWFDYPKEVERLIGPRAEIYRCERCQTLYRPDPNELPRSYTLRF